MSARGQGERSVDAGRLGDLLGLRGGGLPCINHGCSSWRKMLVGRHKEGEVVEFQADIMVNIKILGMN